MNQLAIEVKTDESEALSSLEKLKPQHNNSKNVLEVVRSTLKEASFD